MHPKHPLKAYDGSTYSDISQFNVSEGAIEPNGVINLTSNQNIFDIRDYGAAVDGVTDDAEAVQAAVQAAIAVGGGTIFFPPGTTRIATGTPQVVVPANVFGHYIFEGVSSGTNTGDNATNTQYSGLATSKQDVLISGTNIKTINGQPNPETKAQHRARRIKEYIKEVTKSEELKTARAAVIEPTIQD